ncbi:MAG TPA: hypothetical protein PKC43_06265 [Phycisphaerales bacterium]|nr:hypothetical protein [Phycisphaerales bacterium]HMP37036.1 hypothetical protein [Phycisphaerales bacterium]
MILASASSLLGSIWFALMLGLAGYIVGSVLPVTKLGGLFGKK